MLIYADDDGEWYGLLNDWELSKAFTDGQTDERNRQFDRTVRDSVYLLPFML